MSERISLLVLGPDGFGLDDPSAELVGGMAVSHKFKMAFGGVTPIPELGYMNPDQGPQQEGIGWVARLRDTDADLELARRQYGRTKIDRWSRYLVAGPWGSWASLLSATAGLILGFWAAVDTVHKQEPAVGLVFLIAWSIFFTLVIARLFTGVFHRSWGIGLAMGIVLVVGVFFFGGGVDYVICGIQYFLPGAAICSPK